MSVWRDVLGYEGLYRVNDTSDILGLKRLVVMKTRTLPSGYITLNLCKDGVHKQHYVHRLVAKAFCKGYFEGAHVNHIDKDRSNNNYSNLEWVTQQQNNEYSLARHYLITFPCNKQEVVYNLNKFCREHDLHVSSMCLVSQGKRKHSQDFKCELLGE